jgi:hypothetical protein
MPFVIERAVQTTSASQDTTLDSARSYFFDQAFYVSTTDTSLSRSAPEKVAARVESIDDSIRRLARDMAETMYEAPGIGLAATQVDVHKRRHRH